MALDKWSTGDTITALLINKRGIRRGTTSEIDSEADANMTVGDLLYDTTLGKYKFIKVVNPREYTFLEVRGLQDLWISAGAFMKSSTDSTTFEEKETSTNQLNWHGHKMPDATTSNMWAQWKPMRNIDYSSTIKVSVYWTCAAGSADAKFFIAAVAIGNDDALDAALGTAQSVTDTVTSVNDLMETAQTSAITPGGSPQSGDIYFIRVRRVPSDTSDTLGQDLWVLGISVEFTLLKAVAV